MKKKKRTRCWAALLALVLLVSWFPVPDAMAEVKLKLDTEEVVWLSGEETELEITGSVVKTSRVVYFTEDMEDDIEAILQGENEAEVLKDGTFCISIDYAPEYDTTYYIYAINKKNRIAEKTVSYCIDREAPTITRVVTDDLVFSKDTYYAMKDTIDVRVTATDANGSGVKEIWIYRDGKELERKPADEDGEASFEVPLDKGKDAVNLIYASAVDEVGNEMYEGMFGVLNDGQAIVYDGTTPYISFSSVTDEYHVGRRTYITGDAEFTFNVKTELSGIQSVEVEVNGEELKRDKNNKAFGIVNGYDEENYVISTLQFSDMKTDEYKIKIAVKNMVGNEYQSTYYIFRDTQAPAPESVVIPNVEAEGGQLFSEKGEQYGYYTNQTVKATITMSDGEHGSGVREMTWYLVGENGKKQAEKTVKGKQAKVSIPAKFKGFIYVRAVDYLGNVSDHDYTASGIIAESSKFHKKNGSVQLETPKPVSVDNNGNGLYRTDTSVKITVKDSYSGIRNVMWRVQAAYDTDENYEGICEVSNEGEVSDESWEIQKTDKNLVTELSGSIPVRNNSNDIDVEVTMTDRAGNTSTKSVTVSIDKTNPEIQVDFGDGQPKEFYQKEHVATVRIKERNFDEKNIQYDIKNKDNIMPAISDWKEVKNTENPDETIYMATITFDMDGEYEFTMSYKDRAGRKAQKPQVQRFTIDQTNPMIEVNMNQESDYGIYYAKAPTATVSITEKNFDAGNVKIVGNASADSKKKKFPVISAWSRQEDDVYTAAITFEKDGVYDFSIEAADMAGNKAETYRFGEFCVDQTKPEVEITGITDQGAYKGSVEPVIRISDTNLDLGEVNIKLVGANRGTVAPDGLYEITVTDTHQMIRFNDFAEEKVMDDLYTLTVDGKDRAGNKVEESIHFSVNRFGSVYTVDDSFSEIKGNYVKEAQDVILTETNVDALERESIKVTLFQNGNPVDLTEDEDYTIRKAGGDGKWSQYEYRIDKKNFSSDGSYTVTVSSVDRAGNVNENSDENKAAEISFGIDSTAPVIIPVNVAQDQTFATSRLSANISVADNLILQDVEIFLNGKKAEHKVDGDNYTVEIPESTDKQELYVVAKDAAGNEKEYRIQNLLITSNAIVRWYNNKPVVFATLGIGAGVLCLLVLVIGLLRKNVIHVRKKN